LEDNVKIYLEQCVRVWTGLKWLSIGSRGELSTFTNIRVS